MLGARATFQCHITSWQFTCLWLHRLIDRIHFVLSVIFKYPRDHIYRESKNNNNIIIIILECKFKLPRKRANSFCDAIGTSGFFSQFAKITFKHWFVAYRRNIRVLQIGVAEFILVINFRQEVELMYLLRMRRHYGHKNRRKLCCTLEVEMTAFL